MRKLSFIVLILLLLGMLLLSCTDKYPVVNDGDLAQTSGSGCVDCHTDKELLKQVAAPLPPDTGGSSGEG